MNRNVKRFVVFLLLICLVQSMLPAVSAVPASWDVVTEATGYTSPSDVQYKTVNGYILNWGARGEDCLFLSPKAQSYYTGSYSYASMSALSGGTSQSTAPGSDLYSALQSMMASNHTTYTTYGGSSSLDCKYLYPYTDCMKNNTAYVSTIYQGQTVSSTWDSGQTYNQEHVWPKSKCLTTREIGDIMHLRPANPIENSTRGNTAYGESSGYYNPGISVRGDCARMILYMYVRWGNTSYMWGTSGVMESMDILLRWMAEDPVDTWEMGRNDAVENITGTRNVFVDYPEYAWQLFGQTVPDELVTPSSGSDDSGNTGSGSTTTTAALVTDASSLKSGDQIIIVASDYDYALSTEQKTSNRGQAAITKTGSGAAITYGTDTQIITLGAGTATGTFSFTVGEGQYLYAASSGSNQLKTTDSLTGNSSWTITIDSETGIASVTAIGENTRNTLRYNTSSSLFSCYDPTNTQKDICIYLVGGEVTEPSEPTVPTVSTEPTEPSESTEPTAPENPTVPSGTTALLVSDVSSLAPGDQIIIVAAEYDYALSTEQRNNNRGQAAITKTTNGTTITYGTDTQIITLGAGTAENTFAFMVGDAQYLYAASSTSNHLKTTDTLSADGSWAIAIDPETCIASVTASGENTRNTLRYNTSASLFSCYSPSNTQKDICIYKLVNEIQEDPAPVITFNYPTLSFEGEVFYNVYFSVTEGEAAPEALGLLTWYNRPASTAAATYDTAEAIIPGAVYNPVTNTYMVRSEGVPAKRLGDNMYLRIYAKLKDGSYVYSPVTYYNAKYYASDILANSTNNNMKSLVVAMLNYGAAAQIHFGHNTDSLMNAGLTPQQQALVKDYSPDMISGLVTPDSAKTVNFKSNGGFSGGYPSVSFEGAFAINYYLTPKKAVDGEMILYCWNLSDYNSATILTEENATAKVTMTTGSNIWFAAYTGIAAKQIDETVFVAAVYESGGTRYSSPVITYSLGAYCADQIANSSATMQDFARATVVYGDTAKAYFAAQ